MPRKFFVGGNWKLNGDRESIKAHIDLIEKSGVPENVDVLLAFPSVFLETAASRVAQGNSGILVAAENVSDKDSGAYTGEVSTGMLHDVGVRWALVGHSERRSLFSESDSLLESKLRHCLTSRGPRATSVVFCVGESLSDRENGITHSVLARQLSSLLFLSTSPGSTSTSTSSGSTSTSSGSTSTSTSTSEEGEGEGEGDDAGWVEEVLGRLVVAYEPVWAIGTGKVATPGEAQGAHAFVRSFVRERIGERFAEGLRIVYGGSVKGANCVELAREEDVDGFLVGGASLKPEFVDIIRANEQ